MPVYDIELNAKGLRCPQPLLRAKKGINTLSPGQVIKVLTTDPGSKADFAVFCKQTGHALLEVSEQDGVFNLFVQKSSE